LEVPSKMDDKDILAAVAVGLLSEVKHSEDRPLNKQDFQSHLPVSFSSLEKVENLLDSSCDVKDTTIQFILVFCGQHSSLSSESDPNHPYWSTSQHQNKAEEIKEKLLKLSSVSDLTSLLISNNKKHLIGCLSLILPKLEESFLMHPGEQHTLAWIIEALPHPHLAHQLSRLLPHALRWLDHWIKDNQILGAKVMKHIITNSPPTELKWYGRADLLASALLRLLHSRELEVLQSVCDPLLEITKLQHLGTSPAKPGPADRLIEQVINRLGVESNSDTCSLLCGLLCGLVSTLGPGVARWIPSLATLLAGQLDHPANTQTQMQLLQMWAKVVETAPECANREGEIVIKALIKLMYKASHLEQLEENHQIVKECSGCLMLLAKSSPDSVLQHCHGLDQIKINKIFDVKVAQFMLLAREIKNGQSIEIVSH